MKNKLIVFLAILLIAGFIFDFISNFSIVTAGKVQPIDYVTLQWGSSDNEVGLKGPYENFWYIGPATFDVDNQGNVYIVDQLNSRIIKVDENGQTVRRIDISKIVPQGAPEGLLPVQLIVLNNCMFLLHHYRGGVSMPFGVASSDYLSIITEDNIFTIDAKKLLGYPIGVMMDRINGNKVVLTPSIPPEDIQTWKGPKAIIVNEKGDTQIVRDLVNGSYDGVTPFASLLFDEDKDTHCYRNVRIQVKNPEANKVVFNSSLIENGNLITYSFGVQFTGNKVTFMYQSDDAYNQETETVTTHIAIFTLSPKREENYVMVVGNEERKDMLPPPFSYKVDFALGQDGYFYSLLYMKNGLHIQRFEPEVTQTEYFYRSHKL